MLELVRDEARSFKWLPAVIWAGIILFFSVLPGQCIPLAVGNFDKMAHFFEYSVFAVLMLKGMYRSGRFSFQKNDLFTLITGTLYGILIELLQQFVPGRTASAQDAISNLAGMVFGLILWKTILWRK